MTGVLKRSTIALLHHRISYVAQCVHILTKALPRFILLLIIAYVELMAEEIEACTCVTYIANQILDPWRLHITQANQDCARVWKMDGGCSK